MCFPKHSEPAFSDAVAKAKSFVPPPGHYDVENAETKVYKLYRGERR